MLIESLSPKLNVNEVDGLSRKDGVLDPVIIQMFQNLPLIVNGRMSQKSLYLVQMMNEDRQEGLAILNSFLIELPFVLKIHGKNHLDFRLGTDDFKDGTCPGWNPLTRLLSSDPSGKSTTLRFTRSLFFERNNTNQRRFACEHSNIQKVESGRVEFSDHTTKFFFQEKIEYIFESLGLEPLIEQEPTDTFSIAHRDLKVFELLPDNTARELIPNNSGTYVIEPNSSLLLRSTYTLPNIPFFDDARLGSDLPWGQTVKYDKRIEYSIDTSLEVMHEVNGNGSAPQRSVINQDIDRYRIERPN